MMENGIESTLRRTTADGSPPSRPMRRFQLLSTEITDATNFAEYLTQKQAWCEGKLAVARTLSLVSPAGHSLVSWAAACGQTEVVKILMDHGATAGPGDEARTVSASIIQVGTLEQKSFTIICCIRVHLLLVAGTQWSRKHEKDEGCSRLFRLQSSVLKIFGKLLDFRCP